MFLKYKSLANFIYILFLVISFFTLTYCSDDESNPVNENDDSINLEGYTLVWNDEFNGSSIDNKKWEHEVNGHGGGNNELQYYTPKDDNSYVKDGKLFIVAIKEQFTGPDGTRDYTSARMRTLNRGDWLYGRIEVSAKLPSGRGTWPAIWMLPSDWEYGGWPNSGEIDIMEHVGYDPNRVHGSVHTAAYNHTIGTQKSAVLPVPKAMTEFHTYAVEWFEDRIEFYIDDIFYFTFNNENSGWEKWPFDKRFNLILNIAVVGNWGGVQGIDPNAFPATMEIDYVRVYERTE
jgi:beta-glucanase (GH16 family)